MDRRRRICFVMFVVVGLTVIGRAWAQLQPGIVVEEVTRDSAGEKAGLHPGDILLNWTRGDVKGEIQSPFDLSLLEIEQAPLGTVTLQGFRGEEEHTWPLEDDGAVSEDAGIQARPNLPQNLLGIYLEGQKLAKAGKWNKAVRLWRAAASQAGSKSPQWLGIWFRFRAAGLLAEAQRWKEVDAAYREILQQSKGTGPELIARFYREWGAICAARSDRNTAERYFQEALHKSQEYSTNSLLVAKTVESLGGLAAERYDVAKTEEYAHQSLSLRQQIAPGSESVIASLHLMSVAAYFRGDMAGSEQCAEQILSLREKFDPHGNQTAYALSQLGRMAIYRGDLEQADKYSRRALAIAMENPPSIPGTATSLSTLGEIALKRSDLQKAEEYFRSALAVRESLAPESITVAVNLDLLAQVAWKQGDLARAGKYELRAAKIVEKKAPGTFYAAIVSATQGLLAEDGGDLVKAEKYLRQSLAVHEKAAINSVDLPNDLNNLGKVAWEEGDLVSAERDLRRALAIAEKITPASFWVSESLYDLGNVAHDEGDLVRAKEYYSQALAIREKLAPGSLYHIETLAALASLMRDMQRPEEASRLYEQALDRFEGEYAHFGGSEGVRSGFRAKHISYYKDYVDLLIGQNKPEQAFQVLERSRARALLETLTAAHVDIRKGVEPVLVEKERMLRQDFNAKSQAHIQMLSHPHTEKEVADLDQQIKDILDQYHDVEGQIRSSSPAYAALTQPEPLGITQVQQQLLDSDTLLLEYSLGKKRSYVFAVTPDSLAAYELPKETEIEDLSRKVYALLRAPSRVHKGDTTLQKKERLAKAELEYSRAVTKLSQMVLGPVASQLQSKRLVIISDGALQYIPFSVLPDPVHPSHLPLVVSHEIVNLPSASVLAVLRREEQDRKQPSKAVAVLADPVFSEQDERVENTQMRAELKPKRTLLRAVSQPKEDTLSDLPEDLLTRSVRDIGLLSLPRLPFTRREADSIISVTPTGEGLEAVDFKASRELSLSSELANYRIVHFATHGLVDNQHPELSGLVLSLVDPQGKQQNGFLGLEDIYNLNLPVDMVVLSACETGLGKQINGEGLIGLTRGFMYAGADRVVASLWNVDDVATAELMSRFYKGILQQGLSPAAALRQAQIEMWKQNRWHNPYYWGAFELQGEWKPQNTQTTN